MSLLEVLSPSEVVGLLFAAGVFLFIAIERRQLAKHRDAPLATAAFFVLCAGWVLTILEGFFHREVLNFIEHLCYALGIGMLALWCWRRTSPEREP